MLFTTCCARILNAPRTQYPFVPVRRISKVMMEALLAGDGSIEFPDERATFLCLNLDASPFPKN